MHKLTFMFPFSYNIEPNLKYMSFSRYYDQIGGKFILVFFVYTISQRRSIHIIRLIKEIVDMKRLPKNNF